MSSHTERDYITQGTGRAVTLFPPPAQNQRSRLRAWGRREPRAPPLRSCGPACPRLRTPPSPVTAARARAAHSSGTLAPGVPVDVGGARPWGANARGTARGAGAAGHPRAWATVGRGAQLRGRGTRTRAHTQVRAPRPTAAAAVGPRRHSGAAGARSAPPPTARAPHPPLIVSLRNASAQGKDNGTPGRRGWGAPGLARSLTSRGRRRR